jgi:flagellar biosynthetic protein FliR
VDLFGLVQNQVGFFLLVFIRITGIFMMAPVFGSSNVQGYVKAGLALAISIILFPVIYNAHVTIPDQLLPYVFAVAGEFTVGLILGFVSSLVFSAIQMAGQILDTQIGFGMVNVIDPLSGQQVPLIGNFYYFLAILVFLATNGHHVLLTALFTSFKLVPVSGLVVQSGLTAFIVDLLGGMFVIAMKISLPVLVALLMTDVALGMLARTMPQLNIFVVGVPGKIIVGIFVLSLALPFYIFFLELAFNAMYKDVYHLFAFFA